MTHDLEPVDIDALTRAITVTRKESPARSRQLDYMLADPNRIWQDVAVFAASCAQGRSLRLDPWQTLPFRARLPDDLAKPADDPRGERPAAELLKRLRDAGLSGFE